MNASATPTCCWCGAELIGKRRDAEYCDSTCRANATRWRQSRPAGDAETLRGAATPPVAIIRAEQEAAKSHWSQIVREGIVDCFRRRPAEPFHADDLEPLGIPDEHRNIIGSQIAKLVNQHWVTECGRRKSRIPSRNGAKSNEYRLTELGRDRIAGVGGDGAEHAVVTPHSGDSRPDNPVSGAGVPAGQPEGGASASVPFRTSTAPPDEPEQIGMLAEPDEKAWAA